MTFNQLKISFDSM